jgi:hypothetical protein
MEQQQQHKHRLVPQNQLERGTKTMQKCKPQTTTDKKVMPTKV